jgi:hypothetical protein
VVFLQDFPNVDDVLLLLVPADLRPDGLDLRAGLFILVELAFSCLLAADVLAVGAVDDAAAGLEDAEGEGAPEAEDDAEAFHFKGFNELVFKADLAALALFLFPEFDLLEYLPLSLENRLHRGEVLLGHLSFGEDVLVEGVADEGLPETALVVVETGVDHRAIQEDGLVGGRVFVENGGSALQLLLQVAVEGLQLVRSHPLSCGFLLLFGEFVQRDLLDVHLHFQGVDLWFGFGLGGLRLLGFGLGLFGELLLIEPFDFKRADQLRVVLLGEKTEFEEVLRVKEGHQVVLFIFFDEFEQVVAFLHIIKEL